MRLREEVVVVEGFAAVPTWMIRDTENVSKNAIMVYAVLATRAGLRANVPGQALLAQEARCSERTVRDALTELVELGVVERLKRGSKTGGRATDAYRLMDRPLAADEFPATTAGNSELPANPAGVTGKNEQIAPLIEVDRTEVDICASAHPQSAHSFEEWWQIYPLKKDKGRARTAWKSALKKTTPEVLFTAAAAYRDDPNRAQAFTKYPASWLNAEAWENGPLPARHTSAGGTAVENMLDRMRNRPQGGGGQHAIGA